jgi:hypothetical protein
MTFAHKKRLRILVLVHEDLVPPETTEGLSDKEIAPWKAEYDVATTLEQMGHEIKHCVQHVGRVPRPFII